VSLELPAQLTAPGAPVDIPLPPVGSLVVDGEADARLAAVDPDSLRAIGSVAKAMTALVVLEARPLSASDQGPVLTMTAADVAGYRATVAADGSALAVTEGERLTERQLLLALLLPSANNVADSLGRWVSGSDAAFVALLNHTAVSLGMSRTHFEDASGFSPATESTAADLIRLGRAVLATPTLAELVATPAAVLPDGTPLHNLDSLLTSVPGWLGIKTGETPTAGGCLLFAARRPVGAGASATLVGAVLGQPHLAQALEVARGTAEAAFAGYVGISLTAPPPGGGGSVTTAWGDRSAARLGPSTAAPRALRRGAVLSLDPAVGPVPAPLRTGQRVGTVRARLHGQVVAEWPVLCDSTVPGPSAWWRLVRR
jgi:D-alanyl-D-alanine carboxypeptidase (penicillin-binding protein 5/6)